MTYIDKLKRNNFTKGTDVHLKKPVLLVLIWFIGKLEVKKLMRSTSKNIKPSIILGLVFAQIRKRKKHYHLLLGTLGKIFILKRMWLTNILKKMAWKIVVNEFDACYKFVDELKRYYCRNIDCSITHNVSSEDFAIFIDYNDSSTKAIERIIVYIKKTYTNELYRYCWKIYRPIVHKNKASTDCDYKNSAQIVFTAA